MYFYLVRLLSIFTLLFMVACSSITTPEQDNFVDHNVQCMRYFIYEICVRDFDADKQVDFVYFNDTQETFLYRSDIEPSKLVGLGFPMHRCVQLLNDETQQAANDLLLVSKEDSYQEKSRIKKAMVDSYASYAPTVKACNKKYNNEINLPDEDEESFGEEEFEEF